MLEHLPLLWIYWDPDPDLFVIPYLNHPLRWYGLFFSLGLLMASLIFLPLLKQKLRFRSGLKEQDLKALAYGYMDKLMWFAVIGIVLGARLGHVFFYDWGYYQQHISDIPKVWQGGLASHGGTVGVLLALWLYTRYTRKTYPEITFIDLCDLLAIPASFAAVCIRIGNFFNQEIIGQPTTVPWAVLFGHPAERTSSLPRHPVQLYEAIAYLLTFIVLSLIWKFRRERLPKGTLIGLMFIFIFGSRFILEFVKQPLDSVLDQTTLQTGQLLSLPFIAAGIWLLWCNGAATVPTRTTKKKRLS